MMAMQLSEAARVLDGQLAGGDVAFTGISTDTRTLPAGALFFALQGPNFDGHAYVEVAGEHGAAAAAVQKRARTIRARVRCMLRLQGQRPPFRVRRLGLELVDLQLLEIHLPHAQIIGHPNVPDVVRLHVEVPHGEGIHGHRIGSHQKPVISPEI